MPDKGVPKQFFFTIGGVFGDSYQVSWQDGNLWYLRRPPAGEIEREAVTPTASEWGRFWKQLEALNLWRWQEQYVDMSVRDGVLWSLELTAGGQELNSSGQNAYPPSGRGPSMTRDFRRFLQAVSELLGGLPLH